MYVFRAAPECYSDNVRVIGVEEKQYIVETPCAVGMGLCIGRSMASDLLFYYSILPIIPIIPFSIVLHKDPTRVRIGTLTGGVYVFSI